MSASALASESERPPPLAALPVLQLPSTSPANAGTRLEQKLAKWREGLRPLLSGAR